MDRDMFVGMAKDYISTLHEYDGDIQWVESVWESAAWKAQFIMEGRTVQGFAITEIESFAVFPDILYISEFYIVPEARRRDIGLESVKAITKDWHGDIYLYILDKNTQAKLFWTAVEAELGWKRIERPEIVKETGCELRVFTT